MSLLVAIGSWTFVIINKISAISFPSTEVELQKFFGFFMFGFGCIYSFVAFIYGLRLTYRIAHTRRAEKLKSYFSGKEPNTRKKSHTKGYRVMYR
jgi:hypothetical protein